MSSTNDGPPAATITTTTTTTNGDTSSSPTPALTATYASPSNAPFTIAESLAAGPATTTTTSTVDGKTQYLSALKGSISAAQERLNQELTARMDEDKARDGRAAGAVDDAKEEENYGEEVVEEED